TYTQNQFKSFSLRYYAMAIVCFVLLQACGGGGGATTDTSPVINRPVSTPTNPPKASLTVDCSGAACSAVSPIQYSGNGVGLWRYNNTSTQDALIDIDILGVTPKNQVTLAFTNGERNTAFSVPSIGNNVSAELKTRSNLLANFKSEKVSTLSHSTLEQQSHDAAHSVMMARNQASKKHLIEKTPLEKMQTTVQAETNLAAQRLRAAPAVNTQRVWSDSYPQVPVNYITTNKHICTLPSGRKIVFWQGNNTVNLTPTTLQYFIDNTCGVSGTFARLNNLLGDFWGTNNLYGNIITETVNNQQDVNIVFLNPTITADWAGYFDSKNNFLLNSEANSNQALVFFINASSINQQPDFYLSTLVHEATHLIAFYQNTVARNKNWTAAWLDEILAMMSEDIVVPAAVSYNKMADMRLPDYLKSGGNISLDNWLYVSDTSSHYDMGASLGVFLNRRYGLNVYQQLLTACTTPDLKDDEYACLNNIIVQNGGLGLADELAKMGASMFSKASASTGLVGYGFPRVNTSSYTLQAIDLSNKFLSKPANMFSYHSMSQTYLNDTVPTGATRYIRQSVRVPARTRLQLVIK
ncbi:MAG: hypothetical protein RI956_35, partial [Pseudomonadota bacterium]